ncbi:MAG: amidohydrolase family protein [Cytophagaceae bacterium]|nr:amidohydrolase family protein [Gemmatimonadaceae bacterium]
MTWRLGRCSSALAIAAVLAPIAFGAQPASPAARALVLAHVTVIDVVRGQATPDLDVTIVGNRITAVVRSGGVTRRNAQVVNATGKFLIPGLWDMHSHSLDRWEYSSLLNIANGVTGFRDPGAVKAFSEIVKLRADVEAGRVFGPRFVAAGTIIDGSPSSRATYVTIDTPEQMRAEVARRKTAGLDFIKVYTRLSRDAFLAVAAEGKRLGIPLDGHVPLSLTAVEASNAGMRSIEHSYRHRMACATEENRIRDLLLAQIKAVQAYDDPAYRSTEDEAFRLGLDTYSADRCTELGKAFARNGTWFVPTLVEMATRFDSLFPGQPEFVERFKDPRTQYVPPHKVNEWRANQAFNMGQVEAMIAYRPINFDTLFDQRKREVANRLRMPADLHRGGARLLAGTDVDTTFPFLFYGFSLHDELGLLVKGGLTPIEALRTATINPAEFLHREKDLGTVETGKLADLVLLDANPLELISNTQKIAAVVANGRYLPDPELKKLLERAALIVKK